MATLHKQRKVVGVVTHNEMGTCHNRCRPDGLVLGVAQTWPRSRSCEVADRDQLHDGQEATQHPIGALGERVLVVGPVSG